MTPEYLALLKRVEALEKKQINVTMTNNDDVNAYRAVQRALQTRSLTLGGSNNELPQQSAILALNSRSQGFLAPRTDDLTLIAVPTEGMMVYNYDHEAIEVYNGQAWGLTLPRLTEAQMQALASPLSGMAVFNTTHEAIEHYNGNGWGAFMPILTTTQRDALTAHEGQVIFNTTTNKLNFYGGAAWAVVTSV